MKTKNLRDLCTFRNVQHRMAVHTVAETGGRPRRIFKNMPQVAPAAFTAHFRANHPMADIPMKLQSARIYLLKKGGPTTTRVKFVLGAIETMATADAVKSARARVFQVAAGSGALGRRLAKNGEFQGM
jgi:hypothetical protein